MQPYEILLVDDHPMFRSGLRMVLESELENVEVSEAASLAETCDRPTAPALILLDVQLPGLNGLEAITSLKRRWPNAAIVVLSAFHSRDNVERAYRQGAHTFVPKTDTTSDILSVIKKVRGGNVSSKARQADHRQGWRPTLTPRQCEVLDLIARGHPNKVIARKLGLAENTVRWHVQSLLEILRAGSRSEAVFVARNKGLID